ncbi:MAG: hypothetical protein WKG00_07505 [Polyangiaceae bacterium]
MLLRAALPIALCLSLVGCPCSQSDDDGDVPPQAEDCYAQEVASPEERALEVGALDGTAFSAWADGTEVTLQTGGQGGVMVVPSLRLPAATEDGDEACWVVTLDNEVAGTGAGDIGDLKSAYVFERNGEFMQVDGLFDLLGYDSSGLQGSTLTLTAKVSAQGFRAEKAVAITLR